MASLKIMMNSNSVTSLNSLTNSNDYDQNHPSNQVRRQESFDLKLSNRLQRDAVFGYVQMRDSSHGSRREAGYQPATGYRFSSSNQSLAFSVESVVTIKTIKSFNLKLL